MKVKRLLFLTVLFCLFTIGSFGGLDILQAQINLQQGANPLILNCPVCPSQPNCSTTANPWGPCDPTTKTQTRILDQPAPCNPEVVTQPCTPPGPTPCAAIGDSCASQVASSISLQKDCCGTGYYGFCNPQLAAFQCGSCSQHVIPAGVTEWFFADPGSVGKGSALFTIQDFKQCNTGAAPKVFLYTLDANYNLLKLPIEIKEPGCCGNSSTVSGMNKYLLKITEMGTGAALSIWYK